MESKVQPATGAVMEMPESVITEIRSGIRPKETCGLLSSSFKIYPVTNVSNDPYSFVMHKMEYLRAVNSINAGGESVLAVYHTHPFSPPNPSQQDLDYFNKSPYDMLIVGIKDWYYAKNK